ncbi:MAG: ABC transporter substrate-binding protein [Burkholderiales bacterium]|nr:ABC transporter substrate-binding protein [Burkholderiales bacterium]
MTPTRRQSLKWIAASTLLAPALPALAQGNDIVFGATLPLSGPFAAVAKDQLEGMKDYFDYLNAKGGIRGRKVRFIAEDTQYKVDQAIAAWKKFMASDNPVAVFGDGTGFVRASAQENNERYKVLMTSTSYASDLEDPAKYGYHFMSGPNYSEAVDVLLQYVKTNYKGGGKPKLAVIHSASEFGRDPLAHLKKRADALGIDVVLVLEMKFSGTDVAAETIKLRQARPDYTLIHGFGGAPIFLEVMKLAKDYGLQTQFMGTFWESSRTLMKRAGPAADGFLGVSNYAWVTTGANAPMLKAIDEIKRKRDPKYDGVPDIYYMQGWMSAMLMAKAAEEALAQGKPLTGEGLRDALRATKNWDTGGVIGAPVTFVNNSIPLAQVVRFEAAKDFVPTPVSGWINVDRM